MTNIKLISCHGGDGNQRASSPEASITICSGTVVGRRELFRAAYKACSTAAKKRCCPHCQALRKYKPTVSRQFFRFGEDGEFFFNGDNKERRLFVNSTIVEVEEGGAPMDGKWRRVIKPAKLGPGDGIAILLHLDDEMKARVALEFMVEQSSTTTTPTEKPAPPLSPMNEALLSKTAVPCHGPIVSTTNLRASPEMNGEKLITCPPSNGSPAPNSQTELEMPVSSEPNSPNSGQTEASLISEKDTKQVSLFGTSTAGHVMVEASPSDNITRLPPVTSTPQKTGISERGGTIIKRTPDFLRTIAEQIDQADGNEGSKNDGWSHIGLGSEEGSQSSCASIEVVRVVKPPKALRKRKLVDTTPLDSASCDGVEPTEGAAGRVASAASKKNRTDNKEERGDDTVPSLVTKRKRDVCADNHGFKDRPDLASGPSEEVVVAPANEGTKANGQKKIRVFFVRSKDLAEKRISIFTKLVERKHGQQVVLSWKDATHIVVYTGVSAHHVSEELGLRSARQLRKELDRLCVIMVTQRWIIDQVELREKPTIHQLWNGLIRPRAPARGSAGSSSSIVLARQANAGSRENSQDTKIHAADALARPRNEKLATLFLKLSKAYRKAPLDNMSEIKSRQFHILAGRVRLLGFEITGEEHQLRALSRIKHFGPSSIDIVRDFIRNGGKCDRLDQFEKGERKAMRNFMYIWGVGRQKALDMIRVHGLRTIEEVRTAVKQGKIELTPNQRIGLECYEDFGQKMTRQEVEAIAEIIEKCLKKKFPHVSLTLMGSYRRGKTELGDVDVVILSKDFKSSTPKGAVGDLVSTLMERGHIAHHLTQNIDGIRNSGQSIPLSTESSSQQSNDPQDMIDAPVARYDGTQTYMGVFNSPMVDSTRRRLDIKWYPYNERAYATVHFTGSGFFNRSIRLYALKVKGLKLNDHGLFYVSNPNHRYEPNCETEEELFEALGLEYKRPHERNNFDDVVDRSTGDSVFLSRPELMEATMKEG